MARKTRRVAIALSVIVLIAGAGGGAYWIFERGGGNLYEKAERAFRARKFERAAELARKFLVVQPNREIAQELLVEALIQGEMYLEAKQEAQKYTAQGKDFARVVLCRLAVQEDDMVEAERLARALTDTRPAFSHHVLALLSDNQGIARNNWRLRLAAAATMRGLAALTEREATRATALIFSSQITLEVAPFLGGSERLIQRARDDLKRAVAAVHKAYQSDHAFQYELTMGIIHTLSADEAEAEVGAKTLRKYITSIERSDEVVATLAMYHLGRKEWQEAIDLISDITDSYLWNRVFWVLRHGGHREVALRVLEEAPDADSAVKRLMRADTLLQGDKHEDKEAARKLIEELINDPKSETAVVLRALLMLALRADLETARKVAEAADLVERDDKRITAMLAFLMNTNEEDKGRAIEIARELAEDINTVEESRDMLYLLGGGTDVMNSYLDAQVEKGGESGLQHRLRRALNNIGLARREAGDAKGKHLARVVTDIKAVLADEEATKGALIGAFSIASSVGETDLAGQVLARALAVPGAPELLPVRILKLAFRTVDQSIVKKLADGVRNGADASRAPAYIRIFADLMLTKGEIGAESMDRLDGAAKADANPNAARDLSFRIALDKAELDRAERYARAILLADSNHSMGRQRLGAVLMRRKAYDKVLELYEGVDRSAEGYNQCVGSLEQLGRRDEALKLAKEAFEKFPRSHGSYAVLARIYMDMGDNAKALSVLNVAPTNTFIALMKGELLVRLKDYAMAEQIYEGLLAQTGFTNIVAWGGLHQVLIKQDRGHDFIQITSQVLGSKQLPAEAPRALIHVLRAQTLESKGQIHEALIDYEKAITLNHQAWSALNNAAWHIAQLAPSRIAIAREYIDRALKIRPNEPELLDTAAEVYSVEGKYDLAIKQIDSCLVIAPVKRAGKYLMHKAEILIRAEREPEAREILTQVRADYADTPLAKRAKESIWQLDLKNQADEEDEEEKKDDDGE